jgi:hypothetical protein
MSFHENAGLGSHDKLRLVCRGFLTTYEKPTTNSEDEFIVATPAIFIRGGEPEKVMGDFHENARFGSHADRTWVPTGTCGKRGLAKPTRCPRLAAITVANRLTVSTNASFKKRR